VIEKQFSNTKPTLWMSSNSNPRGGLDRQTKMVFYSSFT